MSEAMPRGIWIITDETAIDEEVGGGRDAVDIGADYGQPEEKNKSGKKRTHVKAEDLKQNMTEFLEVVEEAFEQAEKPKSKIQLDELELSVEVNGSGQVSLLGTGGQAGAKGAIKLKFKRKES